MTRNRAVKLVTEAVNRHIRTYYGFDASLHEAGITSVFAERCYDKQKELEEALSILAEEPAQLRML